MALKDISRTVGYCEIDPDARSVLRARMADGQLERAPIFNDVTKLTEKDVHALAPDMVTAGFPCQDITPINRFAAGILGERSKLVFDVLRLVRATPSIKHVVLENSSHIVSMGMDLLLKEFKRWKWTVVWGLFSSLEVGCHHDRRRWICLASAPGAKLDVSPLLTRMRESKCPPMLAQPSVSNTRACVLLGNAVVPAMIAYACTWLCGAEFSKTGAVCGMLANGKHQGGHRRYGPKTRPLALAFNVDGTLYKKNYWATPTRRKPYNCKVNTSNLRHLSCQVMLERNSKGAGVLNARFVEADGLPSEVGL